MMNTRCIKNTLLLAISLSSITSLLVIGPIKQDSGYYLFADQSTYLSIPNFRNVVSNIPFVIIGIFGVFNVFGKICKTSDFQSLTLFLVFFIGIFLTGIGSAYYHYNPSNETLFWDRLPMTISFTVFFSMIVCEFISIKTGKRLFFPLLISGIFSLIYWQITEDKGIGDLRFYILIQFLPIILTIFILLFYQKESKLHFVCIISLYVLTKFFEMNDHLVFSISNLSGHSIKHLIASAAPLCFLFVLYKRKIDSITYLKFNPEKSEVINKSSNQLI